MAYSRRGTRKPQGGAWGNTCIDRQACVGAAWFGWGLRCLWRPLPRQLLCLGNLGRGHLFPEPF